VATQTTTRLVDDLDGSTADRTVTFAWDGRTYEVDLSKKNANALESALKPYLDAARSTRRAGVRSPRRGARTAAPAKRGNVSEVRDWARANGYEVSERGRIASAVVEAYQAAK